MRGGPQNFRTIRQSFNRKRYGLCVDVCLLSAKVFHRPDGDAQQIQSILLHPWLLIPALPIIITVTCFQFLGDGLRDAADPYSG